MSNPLDLLKKAAIAPPGYAPPTKAGFSLSMEDFDKPFADKPLGQIESAIADSKPPPTDETGQRVRIENSARETIQRMLSEAGIGEPFVFNVYAGTADKYLNNMSQVISRARKRLREQRKKVADFRLNHIRTQRTKNGYDIVTVKRVRPGENMRESEVYKDLDKLLTL